MSATIALDPATDPHPVVNLIIPRLRDAYREIRGVKLLIGRYCLLSEDCPPILERLTTIADETEKRWAARSIFVLRRWVIEEGYPERAPAIAELAQGLGEIGRAEWLRLEAAERDASRAAAERFTGASRPPLPSTQPPAGQSQLSLRALIAQGDDDAG